MGLFKRIVGNEHGWFLPFLVGAVLFGGSKSSNERSSDFPTMPAKKIESKKSWVWDFDFQYPSLFIKSDWPVDVWTSPKGQEATKENGARGWTNITYLPRSSLTWWKNGTRLTIENNGDSDVTVSIGAWGD